MAPVKHQPPESGHRDFIRSSPMRIRFRSPSLVARKSGLPSAWLVSAPIGLPMRKKMIRGGRQVADDHRSITAAGTGHAELALAIG